MASEKSSVFETLNAINVNGHTEKKNNLTYLSWAWAWAEVKKKYPDANYKIYETPEGVFYFTDGHTAWVKTGITIEGLEHIEYLPVMDYKNKSIPIENITSFDVNKAIQRSLTKAVARHGLGLYIYAGEDLPEDTSQRTSEGTEEDAEAAERDKEKEMTEKARAVKINHTEWSSLQKAIIGAELDPERDAREIITYVLSRFGCTPEAWQEITIGNQIEIIKALPSIKKEIAEARLKAEEERKRKEWEKALTEQRQEQG